MMLIQFGRLRFKMSPGDQLLLEMMASLISNWKRNKLNKLFYLKNGQEKLSELLIGDNLKYEKISNNSKTHTFESALTNENHAAYVMQVSPETVDNFMEKTG